MKITEHFTLEEFLKSDTATANNVENIPQTVSELSEFITNSKIICEILEKIRARIIELGLGSFLTISSGYRNRKLNELIKGSLTSLHAKALAADIPLKYIDVVRLMQLDGEFKPYGIELIAEKTVTHVGVNLDGRDEWIEDGAKYQKQ